MATNFEYHKHEIIDFISRNKHIGKVHGMLVECSKIDCCHCDFCLDGSEGEGCRETKIRYFNEEHIEPTKLTESERLFLILVGGTGWIARDGNGDYISTLQSLQRETLHGWGLRVVDFRS